MNWTGPDIKIAVNISLFSTLEINLLERGTANDIRDIVFDVFFCWNKRV